MTSASPALLTRRGAQRLPRLALWIFCAAYVLPGIVGRDPWRQADLASYGLMAAMAEGRTSWWAPMLGQLPVDTALLPHWLGAAFIWLLGPWVGGPLAARLPFAALLALTLVLVWYASYDLARTEAAQPVAFAFGGEAEPVAYARAIADAALLALIASLGLLQLGHETTPELMQLVSVAGLLWALASAPYLRLASALAAPMSLVGLALGGAPAMAMGMGAGATLVCARSSYPQVRAKLGWFMSGTALAAFGAGMAGTWGWRLSESLGAAEALSIARQWAWFLWPVWPAMLWALWRWRHHLNHRHVSVPLVVVIVSLVANIAMGGSDRALMLSLPGCAVLAALALPTLRRSASAAVDWLSMSFFSLSALSIWVIYVSTMTGFPAKPAANVAKLAPGFEPLFSVWALIPALAATLAWLWLLRWRTGRHREAIWKSMVIPAGGVALCWMLLMTLWLPMLDYSRSLRPWVERLAPHVAGAACLTGTGLSLAHVAALETHGGWRVMSDPLACPLRLSVGKGMTPPPAATGWVERAQFRRPSDRDEFTSVWARLPP